LIAIGQKTVNDYLGRGGAGRWGAVQVDERGMTSAEGLFAAAFVIGASTVVGRSGWGARPRSRWIPG
jgi:hypothetical protein